MYQVNVLYSQPEDPAAFDAHYRDVHAGLASKMPGLTSFSAVWCTPGPDGAQPPYHLIATLQADSAEALQAAMGSEEGQAAVADLANFAGAGVAMVMGETTTWV